ncbi:hypothetical protein DXG01_001109 [Tephrocybe rancida]|nr:hypothetical protein DXG01_001109 [Tephrocybe rancida]
MSNRPRPIDHCQHYNAFGYDPNGRMASIAANLYGPDYAPDYDIKQFVGKPEPPKFGPPASFQKRSLPHLTDGTWSPTPAPGAPKRSLLAGSGFEFSDYLDPPALFVPSLYDALHPTQRKRDYKEMTEDDGYETEVVDEEEMRRAWKSRRAILYRGQGVFHATTTTTTAAAASTMTATTDGTATSGTPTAGAGISETALITAIAFSSSMTAVGSSTTASGNSTVNAVATVVSNAMAGSSNAASTRPRPRLVRRCAE